MIFAGNSDISNDQNIILILKKNAEQTKGKKKKKKNKQQGKGSSHRVQPAESGKMLFNRNKKGPYQKLKNWPTTKRKLKIKKKTERKQGN